MSTSYALKSSFGAAAPGVAAVSSSAGGGREWSRPAGGSVAATAGARAHPGRRRRRTGPLGVCRRGVEVAKVLLRRVARPPAPPRGPARTPRSPPPLPPPPRAPVPARALPACRRPRNPGSVGAAGASAGAASGAWSNAAKPESSASVGGAMAAPAPMALPSNAANPSSASVWRRGVVPGAARAPASRRRRTPRIPDLRPARAPARAPAPALAARRRPRSGPPPGGRWARREGAEVGEVFVRGRRGCAPFGAAVAAPTRSREIGTETRVEASDVSRSGLGRRVEGRRRRHGDRRALKTRPPVAGGGTASGAAAIALTSSAATGTASKSRSPRPAGDSGAAAAAAPAEFHIARGAVRSVGWIK